MRRLILVFFLLLTLALPLTVLADGPLHIVAYGETLYSIARKYSISPQALASANGIPISSWVYAGQRLLIPGASNDTADSADASPTGMYAVRAGDTLYSVSRKFGVSVNTIADANNIPPNGMLYTGWQLKIPGAGAGAAVPAARTTSNSAPQAPAPNNSAPALSSNSVANAPASPSTISVSYIVQPGDTLYGIAVKFGVTIQAVQIANNLPTGFVYSSQRLAIPSAASASTRADVAAPANNSAAGLNLAVAGIPRMRQQQTLTCEEAAAAMATRGALTESQIVGAMPSSDNPFEGIRGSTNFPLLGGLTHYGTYAQGLQKGLAKLGHPATAYYGQTYEQFKASILENLREGHPVLWWTTWRETYQQTELVRVSNGTTVPLTPYEHTVVIVAASDQGVTYNDPYDGSVRFTTWANHQRASGYFNNMALVVY